MTLTNFTVQNSFIPIKTIPDSVIDKNQNFQNFRVDFVLGENQETRKN